MEILVITPVCFWFSHLQWAAVLPNMIKSSRGSFVPFKLVAPSGTASLMETAETLAMLTCWPSKNERVCQRQVGPQPLESASLILLSGNSMWVTRILNILCSLSLLKLWDNKCVLYVPDWAVWWWPPQFSADHFDITLSSCSGGVPLSS